MTPIAISNPLVPIIDPHSIISHACLHSSLNLIIPLAVTVSKGKKSMDLAVTLKTAAVRSDRPKVLRSSFLLDRSHDWVRPSTLDPRSSASTIDIVAPTRSARRILIRPSIKRGLSVKEKINEKKKKDIFPSVESHGSLADFPSDPVDHRRTSSISDSLARTRLIDKANETARD